MPKKSLNKKKRYQVTMQRLAKEGKMPTADGKVISASSVDAPTSIKKMFFRGYKVGYED